MIARTTAVVEPGGVLGELTCAPPLTLRQVHGDAADRCDLCLVGTAAGPLPGDDLAISLRLRPGARAALRATAASLAQGRSDRGQSYQRQSCQGQDHTKPRDHDGTATLSIRADLAEGARLVADPGALIVCHGSRVNVRLELTLDTGAAVEWHELIVLGRTGEPPGQATLRWDVTRRGHPILRQFIDLSHPARAMITEGHRVIASALISDPACAPRTMVAGPTAVAQRVNDHTVLVTVLADDAATATRDLAALCARSLAEAHS